MYRYGVDDTRHTPKRYPLKRDPPYLFGVQETGVIWYPFGVRGTRYGVQNTGYRVQRNYSKKRLPRTETTPYLFRSTKILSFKILGYRILGVIFSGVIFSGVLEYSSIRVLRKKIPGFFFFLHFFGFGCAKIYVFLLKKKGKNARYKFFFFCLSCFLFYLFFLFFKKTTMKTFDKLTFFIKGTHCIIKVKVTITRLKTK